MKLTVVVFGASGDLARKKTFPALFELFKNKRLPESARIVGYARSMMDRPSFLKQITQYIKGSAEQVHAFEDICQYLHGQYDLAQDFQSLGQHLSMLEDASKDPDLVRIFYLALPPTVFVPVLHLIRQELVRGTVRVVVEKPFGRDLRSFELLQQSVAGLFTEDEVSCFFNDFLLSCRR